MLTYDRKSASALSVDDSELRIGSVEWLSHVSGDRYSVLKYVWTLAGEQLGFLGNANAVRHINTQHDTIRCVK